MAFIRGTNNNSGNGNVFAAANGGWTVWREASLTITRMTGMVASDWYTADTLQKPGLWNEPFSEWPAVAAMGALKNFDPIPFMTPIGKAL